MKQRYGLIFLFVVLLSGCTEIGRAKTYLLPPSALGMEEVAPKIFVNKEMAFVQRENLAKIAVESR